MNQYTRELEFWRMLELECARLGVGTETVDFQGLPGVVAANRGAELGYIVDLRSGGFEFLHSVIKILENTARPVAVFDQTGKIPIPSQLSENPLMRLFFLAISGKPGEVLGNYLLAQGHRRVAFFRPAQTSHGAAIDTRRLSTCTGEPDSRMRSFITALTAMKNGGASSK